MNRQETHEFIEKMEEYGDIWEESDVKRVYGSISLQEALIDRISILDMFGNIISMVLNCTNYQEL